MKKKAVKGKTTAANSKKKKKQDGNRKKRFVSIVIPTIKQTTMVEDCVLAIKKNTQHVSYEIIVIDDGSSKEIQDDLSRLSKKHGFSLILKDENEGFSKTCNRGIKEAKGDYIVLLNNDVMVEPDWLPPLVKAIEKDKSVGIVGSRLLYPDGKVQHAGIFFDATVETAFDHRYRYWNKDNYQVLQEKTVVGVTFALALIRIEVFKEIGYLDEDMFLSLEDVDFCLRARQAGFNIKYIPRSVAFHLEGKTRGRYFFNMNPEWVVRQIETLDIFFAKWADTNISKQVPDLDGFEKFCREWISADDATF